ncbi:hypothetical protein ACFWN1_22310 [Streptomyces sp. NPDC058459]|uniref:hypothetical protein n=1 Tax=Streptomyces sp. NPDC058459 TaxID=3346508 RepID=UPI0036541C50
MNLVDVPILHVSAIKDLDRGDRPGHHGDGLLNQVSVGYLCVDTAQFQVSDFPTAAAI